RTSDTSPSRAFQAPAAGPRPGPTSATCSGCRVGACSSSETRVQARSPTHCRKARGRSTNAPTGGARSEAGDVVATLTQVRQLQLAEQCDLEEADRDGQRTGCGVRGGVG